MHFGRLAHDIWQRWFLQISAVVALVVVGFVRRLLWRPALPKDAPKTTRTNWPVIGDVGFFTERWAWWKRAIAQSSTGHFSYHIGKNVIVGVSGEQGRKLFYDSKDLAFGEGYAVLFGQSPNYEDVRNQDGFSKWFSTRLIEMLNQGNLVKISPQLLADARSTMDTIASSSTGLCDPYDVIYKLVFLVNMRTVGCKEIADDRKLLEKVLHFYESIENSSTATGIIFPWLLTPAKMKRTYAGARLYMLFNNIAKERKKQEKEIDDPLQFLLDKGDDIQRITAFVIAALFAAQLNSGMNAAWILCYLGHYPEWKARAYQEVRDIAEKYNPGSMLPLRDQLSAIPVEAWENDFEVLDACLRDSIRLQLLGAAFRRNVSGKVLQVGDEIIPNGAFVTYHVGDIHQDGSLYPNPEQWDPSRHLDENAQYRKVPHAFVGWGSGRHPCLGMRFAKLEMGVVLAHFIATFEFETVEKDGGVIEEMPRVDQDGHAATKPQRPMLLKVKRRAE